MDEWQLTSSSCQSHSAPSELDLCQGQQTRSSAVADACVVVSLLQRLHCHRTAWVIGCISGNAFKITYNLRLGVLSNLSCKPLSQLDDTCYSAVQVQETKRLRRTTGEFLRCQGGVRLEQSCLV